MVCVQCGSTVQGQSCLRCGTAIVSTAPSSLSGCGNWDTEVRYEALLRLPQIRAAVNRSAGLSRKRMTGEKFLSVCDAISPLSLLGFSFQEIAEREHGNSKIATGKKRIQQVDAPIGRTIVRILCSLAKHGQTLRGIKQLEDGCVFEATLPSDMWAFAGDLLITARGTQATSEVTAATQIKGQAFDWGKSRRALNTLFNDLLIDPS